MDEPRLDRRRVLAAGGALGLLGLAGCLDVFEDRDLPTYEQYLFPTEAEEQVFYMYAALGALEDLEDDFFDPGANPGDDNSSTAGDGSADGSQEQDDATGGTETGPEAPEGENDTGRAGGDPLLTSPVGSLVSLAFFATFTLNVAGLDWLVEASDATDHESSVEDLLYVNDAVVVTGTLDTAEIDADLRTVPENSFFQQEYEQVDMRHGHDLYAPVDRDETDSRARTGGGGQSGAGGDDGNADGTETEAASVVALDETRLVAGPRPTVERCLAAALGEGERAAATYDSFGWLLSKAESAHLAMGAYGPGGYQDPDEEADNESAPVKEGTNPLSDLPEPEGIISSLTFTADSKTADAVFGAVLTASLSDDERQEFEAALGTAATDVSYDYDGERATVTGTYDEDALEAAMDTAADESL